MSARKHNLATLAYVGIVGAAGLTLLGTSLAHAGRAAHLDLRLAGWAVLAVMTLFLGRLSVRLAFPDCIVSFSDALIFLAVPLFGCDLATITGALDGFSASKRERGGWDKRLFNTAGMAISVWLSARLFGWAAGADGSARGPERLLLAMILLAAAQYGVNTALVAVAVAFSENVSPLKVLRDSFAWAGSASLAGLLAAAVVFVLIRKVGAVTCLAILPVPVVLHFACRAALQRAAVKAPSRG